MRTADERGCAWETVGKYLEQLDNGGATRRIVYLADQFGIDLPTRETLVESFTSDSPCWTRCSLKRARPTARIVSGQRQATTLEPMES